MLQIAVTDEAKNYLLKKGTKEVRIEHAECGGWGGSAIRPAVLAGAPSDNASYDHQHVDGLDVYISDRIKAQPNGIRITLGGWGPFRFITLEGAL